MHGPSECPHRLSLARAFSACKAGNPKAQGNALGGGCPPYPEALKERYNGLTSVRRTGRTRDGRSIRHGHIAHPDPTADSDVRRRVEFRFTDSHGATGRDWSPIIGALKGRYRGSERRAKARGQNAGPAQSHT